MNTVNEANREKLRVGVVGMGIGRHHLAAYNSLSELYEIVALCDIDQPKMEETAAQLNLSPRLFTDLAELCRMDEVDIIDVCTPPHLHVPMVLQVLEAGKYAVCEKPLASSVADVDKVIEAEAQSGKRVMPIFQYRFGHGIQKLRMLIDAGLTGQAYLSTVETSWRRRAAYYDIPWRGKWKTELGGAIVGHAIHNHDLLCYAMGSIKSVFARVKTLVNQIEVDDTAVIAAEMADGSLATSSLTLGSSAEISRMRFSFANLSAESSTKPYSCGADPWIFSPDTPEASSLIEESLAGFEPLPEGFPGQLHRFYHAIKEGTELPVTVQDARRSMELISAIYYSDRTGRPVELPLGPDHPTYQSWMPDNID